MKTTLNTLRHHTRREFHAGSAAPMRHQMRGGTFPWPFCHFPFGRSVNAFRYAFYPCLSSDPLEHLPPIWQLAPITFVLRWRRTAAVL